MKIGRRRLCHTGLAVGGFALLRAGSVLAQQGSASIRVESLNHVTLSVPNVGRSIAFYQSLFGTPIQARQSTGTVSLRLGSGHHLGLTTAPAGERPHLDHYCLGVRDFDVDEVLDHLAEQGITRSDSRAPLTVRVRVRGRDEGGASQGTPELYVYDPDGIAVQLQDTRYCGGAGVLGNECSSLEPSPAAGRLVTDDFNHVTLNVSDRERSLDFYQRVLGLPIQGYQGTTPLLGIGSGPQFVTAAPSTATGAAPGQPGIAHVCLTVQGFDPERITQILGDLGIRRRQGTGNVVGPLTSFVTMRMEDRGGAEGGTPEFYFTDQDGIYVQLQDESYCGGSGYLGNEC